MLTTLRTQACETVDPFADSVWDTLVADIPGSGVFHTSAWARVLAETYGYRPCYLLREGPSGTAALPLMEVVSWLTGRRGVSMPFTDSCGPVGSDSEGIVMVSEAATTIGRQRGWKYVELRDASASGGTESARFLNHDVNLAPGASALWDAIDGSARRAVRKSEEQGLTVEFSSSLASVSEFYHLLKMTRRRHGAPPQPYRFFEAIHRNLLSKGLGQVVLARCENKAIAGAVYLTHGRIVTYKFGASDLRYQHLRANNLVMWSAISRYSQRGFFRLDLGRTDRDQMGLRQFKLAWGATESEVIYRRIPCAEILPKGNVHGIARSYARILKHLPAPLFNSIGNLLYKHIG